MDQSEAQIVLRCAEQGNKLTLQRIIEEGKVGVVDDEENTPLMYAAASGREEILRMLLEEKCLSHNNLDERSLGKKYIDVHNLYGWSALMQAAAYGHSGCVTLLLQRGADILMLNAWGASALVLASQGGHFALVHTLLNHKAQVDIPNDGGLLSRTLTPLMAAAQCGHVEVVRELLRGGAKLEVKLEATRWTALMLAALNNKLSTVELLLSNGAKKDSQDIESKTAGDLARTLGHQNIVVLLAGGTIKNNSGNEFLEAVSKGDVSQVTTLLQMKPSLASMEDKGGTTPLMVASNKGHKEVCGVLLECKAEVNTKDKKYGWTALMHATHNKKHEVAKLLGEHGADVNIRDNNRSTAYDIATMKGDIKMIKLIANITIERLQQKTTPTDDPVQDEAPPTPTTLADPSSSEDVKAKVIFKPPNHMELRARLQRAYQTTDTPPNIAVTEVSGDPVPVSQSRFPSPRSHPVQSPFALSTSSASSSSSSSPSPSPSSSSNGPPLHSRGSAEGSHHFKHPHHSPSSSNNPFASPPRHAPKLNLSGPKATPPPGPNHPLISPQISSRPLVLGTNRNKPTALKFTSPNIGKSNEEIFLRHTPGSGTPSHIGTPGSSGTPSHSGTPGSSGTPSHSGTPSRGNSDYFKVKPLKRDGELHKVGGSRRRANTEPSSPLYRHDKQLLGRGRGGPGGGGGGGGSSVIMARQISSSSKEERLKTTLVQASLQRYYSIFKEQEIDYESFVSLSDGDLCELGIMNRADRSQLMALIGRLNRPIKEVVSTSMDNDVFIFQ